MSEAAQQTRVRFIRKNGRIIPIRERLSAGAQSLVTGSLAAGSIYGLSKSSSIVGSHGSRIKKLSEKNMKYAEKLANRLQKRIISRKATPKFRAEMVNRIKAVAARAGKLSLRADKYALAKTVLKRGALVAGSIGIGNSLLNGYEAIRGKDASNKEIIAGHGAGFSISAVSSAAIQNKLASGSKLSKLNRVLKMVI
jgi:hypothetical protein